MSHRLKALDTTRQFWFQLVLLVESYRGGLPGLHRRTEVVTTGILLKRPYLQKQYSPGSSTSITVIYSYYAHGRSRRTGL